VEAVSDDLPTFSTGIEAASRDADEDWRGLFADLAVGRSQALENLYNAAANQLYGLALWRTKSEEDAADVVQEVFIRVVGQGRRLAKVKNPRAWLMTVTNRAAIDVIRRRRRRPTEALEDHVLLTATDDDGERFFDTTQVSALLAGLPDALRVVIYLKHFAGCTFAEIGRIVGVPKFTAASRYRSGIQKLRILVEGDHEAR
jgi:RNA polymerase sigma-70 factor (ECF subfamily)